MFVDCNQYLQKIVTMPKTGLSTREWRKRLESYARGEFAFGRGQRPSKSSTWAKVLGNIDQCPMHHSQGGRDPFGRILKCACGYRTSAASVSTCLIDSCHNRVSLINII